MNTSDSETSAALPQRFAPGELLAGRFEVIRLLGRGGMGEVYEAADRYLDGSRVAIKTLLLEHALVSEARLRLKSEVLLARQVTHPNVCPIYDLYECDEGAPLCFLSMKLLGGETLARRLRRAPLSQEQKVGIAEQLCGALRAAHKAGVVHRDLKPGNVMLEGDEGALKATVTDFGIALAYEPDRTVAATKHYAGTPGYMAPELLAGYPATPATDLYSLGVVLHEVFTGRKPAGAAMQLRTLRQDLRNMPGWCYRLLKGCLDTQPAARTDAFEQALHHQKIEARGGPFEAWGVSRRTLLKVGAGIATSALVGEFVPWSKMWHPLPRKRFVAVMQMPGLFDEKVGPLVGGVVEAIESALTRAEAWDHNLYITSGSGVSGSERDVLKEVRNTTGVNLALAAHGSLAGDSLVLVLKVLDCVTDAAVRVKRVVTAQADMQATVHEAVEAAAELLDVRLPRSGVQQPSLATNSEQAYKLFQTAELNWKQPNDEGLEKAMENYRGAVEADPRYGQAYAKLALAYAEYFALHRDAAALELARRNAEIALKCDPNLVTGYMALSIYYDYLGNEKEAFEHINRALALDPTNAWTMYAKAQLYWRRSRWAEAEKIYGEILQQRPNYWSAYNELGCVLEQQGRYQEALAAFRTETIANPRTYLGFSNLGDVNYQLGNAEEAKQNYRRSLKLKPNSFAYVGMGTELRAEKKYDAALPYLQKAAELSPGEDQIWLNLGDGCASLKRENEALSCYAKARKLAEDVVKRDATDSGAWIRLALYAKKTGAGEDVLAIAQKGNPTDALDLDAQVTWARIFELSGRRKQAIELLRKCFQRGLRMREISYIPDFQALIKTPEFGPYLTKQ